MGLRGKCNSDLVASMTLFSPENGLRLENLQEP
jgi:hypothetical protein